MRTIHARQIQFPKMHIRKTTPSEESTVYNTLISLNSKFLDCNEIRTT